MRKLLPTCLAIATVMLACDKKTPTGPDKIDLNPSAGPGLTPPAPGPLTAAFVFSPSSPRLNQGVAFNAIQSAVPAGHVIKNYSWDFDDGETAVGVNASHAYAAEGAYNVTLTVTDDTDKTATISHPVPVGGTLPTTTTTVSPISLLVRYVSTQVPPTVPSDMTLNFRLLSGGQSSLFRTRLTNLQPQADSTYDVQGVFSTVSGLTGTVKGSFGGTITPEVVGTFDGTLTGNPPGCSAERIFRGSINQLLLWTGGETLRNTCGDGNNPLAFPSVSLVRTTSNTPVSPTPTTTASVNGVITNARTGQPVAGATVAFAGVPTMVTNANGAFSIASLAPGVRAVNVTAPDYSPRSDTVTLVAGANTYSPTLTPITGNITAVLTWGELPLDLDLHLILPDQTDIFFDNPTGAYAALDHDDLESFGPETMTVFPVNGLFVPGTYQLLVYNFSQTPGFNASSPVVALSQGGIPIAQFAASGASGNPALPIWSVFSFTLAASPSGRIAVTSVQQFMSNDARLSRARSAKR